MGCSLAAITGGFPCVCIFVHTSLYAAMYFASVASRCPCFQGLLPFLHSAAAQVLGSLGHVPSQHFSLNLCLILSPKVGLLSRAHVHGVGDGGGLARPHTLWPPFRQAVRCGSGKGAFVGSPSSAPHSQCGGRGPLVRFWIYVLGAAQMLWFSVLCGSELMPWVLVSTPNRVPSRQNLGKSKRAQDVS